MKRKEAETRVKTPKKPGTLEPRPESSLTPFDEMDRMFDRMFGSSWMHPFRWHGPWWREMAAPFEGLTPSVDVIDRDKEILVRAEVPGVKKDELDVSLTENRVTIHGNTRHEEKTEEGNYLRREMATGSFSRTVTLPAEVDGSKAKASFKDGILELTLPKVKAAERRTIEVE